MDNAFAGLVKALSDHLGAKLEIADDVKVRVNFDDIALLIEHLADGEQVLLAAPVALVPAAGREDFYRRLLQGQHVFAETRGATLSLDAEASFVSLQMAPSLRALTKENFPGLVENFVALVEYWNKRCLEPAEVGERPETSMPAPESAPGENVQFI